MNGFKKTKIALATATAILATTAAISAPLIDVNRTGVEPVYAINLLGNSTAIVTNTATVDIDALIGGNFIGRTTGFAVRITLTGGETFTAGTAATIGAALNSVTPAEDWILTATPALPSTTLTITASPGVAPYAIQQGTMITFAAGAINVGAVNTTLGVGTDVVADVVLFDPVTTNTLETISNVVLFTSGEATAYSVTATGGNTTTRIDVGGQVNASKTDLSADGTINNATPVNFYHVGRATVGLTAAKSASGTAAVAWDSNGAPVGGTFQYSVAADRAYFTLSGDEGNLTGVTNVWLEDASAVVGAACDGVGDTLLSTGTTLAGGVAHMIAPLTAASGETYDVCLSTGAIPATTVINDQTLTGSISVDLDYTGAAVLNLAAVPLEIFAGGNFLGGAPAPGSQLLVDNTTAGMGALQPLAYNGDVLEVHFFNDDGNIDKESRLRVTNKGSTVGTVRIHGIDDAGTGSATDATFTLGAGESVNLKTGEIIQGGGAIITGSGIGLPPLGSGKYRLIVTAEYDGLEVTNYVRNKSAGILTNFTPSKEATGN